MQEQELEEVFSQILILEESEALEEEAFKHAVLILKRRPDKDSFQVLKSYSVFIRGRYVSASDINILKEKEPHLFV